MFRSGGYYGHNTDKRLIKALTSRGVVLENAIQIVAEENLIPIRRNLREILSDNNVRLTIPRRRNPPPTVTMVPPPLLPPTYRSRLYTRKVVQPPTIPLPPPLPPTYRSRLYTRRVVQPPTIRHFNNFTLTMLEHLRILTNQSLKRLSSKKQKEFRDIVEQLFGTRIINNLTSSQKRRLINLIDQEINLR